MARYGSSWWSTLFAGDDDPAAVAAGGEALRCPRHPETAIRLFCDCGQPLSERVGLRSGAPAGLAIAGPPGAGKTLLLIAMMQELHRLEIGGRPLGVVGLGDTEERFHRLSSELLDHGRKPGRARPGDAAPEEAGETADRRFGWAVSIDGGGRRRRRHPELLLVNDLDGDAWGQPRHLQRPRLDRYLDHLRSLAFLVDGRSVAADLGAATPDAWDPGPAAGDRGAGARQGFSRVEERLGRRARRIDLALVVSKADSLWEDDEWRGLRPDAGAADDERRELLEELLRRSRRRDVLIAARQKFRRVELFAASSLGFLPTPEDVDDAGGLRHRPQPTGVVEFLEWLLRQRLAP